MKKDIADVKAEFRKTTDDLDKKVEQVTKIAERTEMMVQYKVTENYLRFRGLEEQEDETIRARMVEILAGFLNQKPERVEDKINLLYMQKGRNCQEM